MGLAPLLLLPPLMAPAALEYTLLVTYECDNDTSHTQIVLSTRPEDIKRPLLPAVTVAAPSCGRQCASTNPIRSSSSTRSPVPSEAHTQWSSGETATDFTCSCALGRARGPVALDAVSASGVAVRHARETPPVRMSR